MENKDIEDYGRGPRMLAMVIILGLFLAFVAACVLMWYFAVEYGVHP
jgi:hypothetical protein